MPTLRKCPCGCGQDLPPYNGAVPLVCYGMWQDVPESLKKLWTWGKALEKRVAARRILEIARTVREMRKN